MACSHSVSIAIYVCKHLIKSGFQKQHCPESYSSIYLSPPLVQLPATTCLINVMGLLIMHLQQEIVALSDLTGHLHSFLVLIVASPGKAGSYICMWITLAINMITP